MHFCQTLLLVKKREVNFFLYCYWQLIGGITQAFCIKINVKNVIDFFGGIKKSLDKFI